MPERVRTHVVVRGVVQGVGFRPFVHALAGRHGLSGWVRNTAAGVELEVEGRADAVHAFVAALRDEAPPLAAVTAAHATPTAPLGATGFAILPSAAPAGGVAFVPPDVATCPDCLRELADPADRRWRYPFVNCTRCGPRFTIIEALPYDRSATTMAAFAMCAACAAEYHDPHDRRFHAQPIACPACGPRLAWHLPAGPTSPATTDGDATPGRTPGCTGEAALEAARAALAAGRIVAVQGLGGFHLLCDATDPSPVAALRHRKGRGDKPFAVLVRDRATAEAYGAFDAPARAALVSRARPIVLVRRADPSPRAPLADGVAPGAALVGLLLPYTPLHHLLLDDRPLVCTSGNRSEEPICRTADEAFARLAGVADAFLVHDRPIARVCDDSVVRVVDGAVQPLRRSRGYTPLPVALPHDASGILAVGGDLKAVPALGVGETAVLAQHLGDMGSVEALRAFERTVEGLATLFAQPVTAVVCDRHPGYAGGRWAEARAATLGCPLVRVQHHHAHAVAAMAEAGLADGDAVLALVLDGTGYGTDGAVWGGELLRATRTAFERLAHLGYLPLPGGDAAIRHPARVALAALRAHSVAWDGRLAPVAAVREPDRRVLAAQLARGAQVVPHASAGRLFDAAAALAGLCQRQAFEGQAAMALEAAATSAGDPWPLSLPWRDTGGAAGARWTWDAGALLGQVAAAMLAGAPAERVALGVHHALASALVEGVLAARAVTGLARVALSGGVFQNALLSVLVADGLRTAGCEVLQHRVVPANDGGLALGQVALAAALRHHSAVPPCR